MKIRSRKGGFNLIEVTLAVAIVALGLLSVLGLLAGSVNASRNVSSETLGAHLTDDMFNWARITPFEKKSFLPFGSSLTNRNVESVVTGLDINGNFSVIEYQNLPNSNWAGSYFRFTYTPQNHPRFPGSNAMTRIVVKVEWPVNPVTGVPLSNANSRTFVTQVARRQP